MTYFIICNWKGLFKNEQMDMNIPNNLRSRERGQGQTVPDCSVMNRTKVSILVLIRNSLCRTRSSHIIVDNHYRFTLKSNRSYLSQVLLWNLVVHHRSSQLFHFWMNLNKFSLQIPQFVSRKKDKNFALKKSFHRLEIQVVFFSEFGILTKLIYNLNFVFERGLFTICLSTLGKCGYQTKSLEK